jgi:cytochrome P450
VFGINTTRAAEMFKEQPSLLNKCPFTLAVIKETFRLYPPAAIMRAGQPGITVTDPHGNRYPMDHVGATILHPAVHRSSRVWPSPEKFLPARFLVEPGHKLYPKPGAFKPFEQGPRNCIGWILVYNEIRTVMVMTVRTFDISPAYGEWDAIKQGEMDTFQKLKTKL